MDSLTLELCSYPLDPTGPFTLRNKKAVQREDTKDRAVTVGVTNTAVTLFGDAHLGVIPHRAVGFGGVEEALFGGRCQRHELCPVQ